MWVRILKFIKRRLISDPVINIYLGSAGSRCFSFFKGYSIHRSQIHRDIRQYSQQPARCHDSTFQTFIDVHFVATVQFTFPGRAPPDMLTPHLFNLIRVKNTGFSYSIILTLRCRNENMLMYSYIWKRGGALEGAGPADWTPKWKTPGWKFADCPSFSHTFPRSFNSLFTSSFFTFSYYSGIFWLNTFWKIMTHGCCQCVCVCVLVTLSLLTCVNQHSALFSVMFLLPALRDKLGRSVCSGICSLCASSQPVQL